MQNFTPKNYNYFKLISLIFLFFITVQTRAQFPFFESFKNSTATNIQFGGFPSAFLTGGAGSRDGYNDLEGNGFLRLTNNTTTQQGMIWSDSYAFPSFYGMTISFEYYTHSGNNSTGADGICFVLFDAATPVVTPGAYGGSLGYAQSYSKKGFSGGYLGVGIDEYGNFASKNEEKTNGYSTMVPNSIVLRGAGSGTNGYPFLTSVSPSFSISGKDRTATDNSKANFRKIEIVLKPRSAGGFFIDLYLTKGNNKSLIINNFEYTTPAPENLKFAITSSTGMDYNFHEIRNLNISADLATLSNPKAEPNSFSGCAGLKASTSTDINTNNNGSVNTLGTINRESIDLDLDMPGIQSFKTIAGKGTFTYDSTTGKVTFTPLNNSITGFAEINYTFNDSYGKTSNVSTITYNSIVNKPTNVETTATIYAGDIYTWAANGQSYTTTQTGLKIINDGCTADQVLNLTVNPPATPPSTTDVNICKGGTGFLTIEGNQSIAVTKFDGHWNAATDPRAVIPITTACNFSTNTANYTATNFTVSLSGIYTLKMTDTDSYDGTAYIYTGNFIPGHCSGPGKWIVGDDDSDGGGKEPRLKAYFEAGVVYTLISTQWSYESKTFVGDYTWTITPPANGEFFVENLNYWYTSASGGVPIGWGNSFNPVGVAGSGLANTNTSGTTTYYVGDMTNSPRTPLTFTIKNDITAGTASSTPTLCVNNTLTNITHSTTGATGIESSINLPTGVKASFTNNIITISGTPTVTGVFNYTINLVKDNNYCGAATATGTIIVNNEPATPTISYPEPSYSTTQGTVPVTRNGIAGGKYTATPKGLSIDENTGTINTNTSTEDIYKVVYTYTNGICTTTAETTIKIGSPKIASWLLVNDQNGNGTVEPGEILTYILRLSNINPDRETLRNVTGSIDIPSHTTLVNQSDLLFVTPSKFAFSGTPDFPYLWDLNFQREPYLRITVKADCDLTGVSQIETIGRIYIDGVEIETSLPPIPVSSDGNWQIISGNLKHQNPPTLANCTDPAGCPTSLPVSATKVAVLNINNPNPVCTPNTVDLATTVNTNSTPGTLTYWKDASATISLTNASTIAISGTYYIKSTSAQGCEIIKPVIVTINPKPAAVITTKNICFGESFVWPINGQTYNTSGTYTKTNDGCTADQTLELNIGTKPTTIITTKNICFGESFVWPVDGKTYTTSGTYNKTNDGCTADQTLELNIGTKPTTVITTKNICFGESFVWPVDGKTYNTSGTYTKTNDGCTADQTLELNIGTKPTTVITTKNICFGESFTWAIDGKTYNASGTYTKTNDGCTADQTLELNIGTKPATVTTSKSICFGESFTWSVDGKTYSASGIYNKTNDGCTADQTLELSIGTKPATVITTENICFGESFVWPVDGQTYSASGTYTKTNDGCTADQTLELSIGTKPTTVITTKNICFGESFVWPVDGQTYSASGIYTKTNDGCTADQTLELTVGAKPKTIITTKNICFGESFVWPVDGQTYNTSGTYTKTNDGCTADQTLELSIGTKPATVTTSKDICFGESFVWPVDGQTYNASGTYTKTNDGCTADQTLELNIGTKPATVTTSKNICFGESFTWAVDGKTYNASGTYTKNNDGCTADQTLELSIGTKPTTIITTKNICFGESFVWPVDGQTYSASGIYTKTNDGCTADQTLELNIGTKPATVITTENICFGESFTWSVDGKTYSASGTYTKTNDGCTADQTLELTIGTKPATVITTENICFGESFVWPVDGQTYSASGTYTKTNDGCTADQTLELTVGAKPTTIITKENICFGESFVWPVDGQTYNTSGTYTKTNDGCTADQTLELSIGNKPVTVITKENICFGESFVWPVDGQTYSASGTYTKTNDGCTADQTLELNIGTKPATVITTENICFGESFVWPVNGQTYSASGTYTKTNDGCTADQTLELNIGTKPATVITKENICFGESFTWPVDGQTYNASGIYTKTNDGCTADQTLELNIGTKPTTIITTKNICSGESFVWPVDGQTYSASGTYTKTNDGCTADQILELSIGTKPTTIITKENICFGESFVWPINGQTYNTSGTYTKTNDGCTADQTLELSIGTKPTTIITTKNICSGESFVWPVDGQTYSASGTYTKTNDGCTADQILELSIGTKPTTIITKENICFGESFVWPINGQTYNTSGTYTKTNDGCTADQTLELNIGTKPTTIITTKNICFGESFVWPVDGQTYNTSGTYTKTNDGCTADQTLELSIGTKPATVITPKNICFGESFVWPVDGQTYSASGIYTKTNDGCTADQTLELNIGTKPTTVITTENICFGESFTWAVDGKTYSASGTYTKTNDGCTADQTLELNIGTKPATVITKENICFGESFTWPVDGQTYNASGIYTKTNDGCTADQTLELNIGTKPTTIITTKNICSGESFVWPVDGQTYSASGTYTKTNDGCTADQILELSIGTKPTTIITKENICFGESFVWPINGQTYNTSGTYTKTNDGCTADQTLELSIGTKPTTIITTKNICSGESFVWPVDGQTYSASGTYTKTNDGCTADQTLELSIGTKPATVITTKNICFGESFTWTVDGKTYNASGTYTKTNDGCTADQTLELSIGTKPATVTTTKNICFGESFTWSVDGKTYSASGTYTKTNDGCTADQTLELNIGTKPATVTTTENICFGESFTWAVDGKTYSASGIYNKTNDGCTADQTLELNIGTKPATVTTSKDICFGESFTWAVDGKTYSASGIYTKTNDGCTADQTLELTIGTKPTTVITTENICFGESFTWSVDGKTYTTSGTYTKTNDGCTADQTLELSIGTKPATVITTENICFGESFVWPVDGQTYSASGTYTKTNDGCTADQTLELSIGTKPATVITTKNICFGESFTWSVDGKTYNASGTYTKTNDGCTADQTLELSIGTKPATVTTTKNICFGESFTWSVDGKTYSASGTYTKTNDGCTADQTLELSIGTKPATVTTSKDICFGESFVWPVDGQTYSASGTYTKTNDGCTADQTLELSIGTKPATVITTKNICFGESFVWPVDGQTYNASGTYTKTNDGCTADQTLELSIGTKPATVTTTKNICFGESFTWTVDGKTYNASGTYTKTNDGCTADQTLELNIGTKPAAITSKISICYGESLLWNADRKTYTTSGIYTKTNDGCAADQVLELTVGAKPATVTTTKNICFGESFTWSVNGQTYTASGTYTKTNNGCTADQVLELNISRPLNASLIPNSIIPESCYGENNASFEIEITGGIKPYSINLDDKNGTHTQITNSEYTFMNLAGGLHTVYIKDALNCISEFEVLIPNTITVDPVANVSYSCLNDLPSNSVTITVNPNINSEDLDYSLDGITYQSDKTFINVIAGDHVIKVRHTNGCIESTTEFVVDNIEPLKLTLVDGELNEIVATATEGNGQYRYSFNNEPFSTSNKFIIYKSGMYTVTVTDQNGCSATSTRYFEYIDVCISNYFTPNGDGVNDEWGPDCTVNYKNLTYTIFDRYGRTIATYKLGQKWDGKYNGAELTSGDYWYVLKLNDPKDNREFVGHFTLYR